MPNAVTKAASGGFEVLPTLTIKKNGGTGTMTIARKKDGSFEFNDKNGKTVRLHSHTDDAFRKLFEAINALA